MSKLKYYYIFIVVLSTSCNSQVSNSNSPTFTKFPSEINLKETNFYKFKTGIPKGILLVNDTLIVLRNPTGSNNHFTVINRNNTSLVKNLLPVGRKDKQALAFLSYGSIDNNIWVYDIIKEKTILIDLYDTLSKNHINEFKSPFYYSIQLINDSIFIGTGDYDSDFKISKYNIKREKLIEQMSAYKNENKDTFSREQKMAFESFIFLKPSGEKCVLARRYADEIEIINLKTKTSTKIRGPEGYEPNVMFAVGNDGRKISTRNEETRFSFVKGKTTNEYIYLLYSGNNHLSKHIDYGNCLYVYDWNGNPIKKLNFFDYIVDFAVSTNNQFIYAYHPSSKYITISKHSFDEKN